jgi:hypothetical protein
VLVGISATPTRALDYKDFLGSWCSTTARLTFTRDQMKVLLFSGSKTWANKVTKYKFSTTTVIVHWILDNKPASSAYGEFSADRKTMFLQKGKNTPRREYHRCG